MILVLLETAPVVVCILPLVDEIFSVGVVMHPTDISPVVVIVVILFYCCIIQCKMFFNMHTCISHISNRRSNKIFSNDMYFQIV